MDMRTKYLFDPCQVSTVDDANWGKVYIRQLTLGEIERLQKSEEKGDVESVLTQLLFGVGNENGHRVFGDEDYEALKSVPWNTVLNVTKAIKEFNKLTAEAIAGEKRLREDTYTRFRLSLCLAFGCTLNELNQRMTVQELITWFAYSQIEPWGARRMEASVAIAGSAICQSLGGKVDAEQLIPKWEREQQGLTFEEFVQWGKLHNERVSGS